MDIQSTELESAFQLYPMLIPGWRPSVRPTGIAHGGIPQSIYQAPDGLFMVIDPLTTLSAPMAAYDTVELWINGKATSVIKIIQPGEENKRIALSLPPGWLNDGINKAFYRVERPGGNFECSEPVLDLLYHNPAPGYPAPGGMTVSHPANVGPAEAAAGVEITAAVSFTRLYDEVTLTVGTWSRSITVTDVTKPLAWTLTAADFQQIGDNPQTPVSARVVDQLGNSNLSATTFMNIYASQSQDAVAFLNGPYTVAVGGQLRDIRMSLTRAGQPVTGVITVTLPVGSVYADGAGGARDFSTRADGTLTVSGVKAGGAAGAFSLTAASGRAVARAPLTITAYGPDGPIALDPVPTGVTLSADGSLAYVTGAGSVQIIDTASSRRIKKISLPQLDVSYEIALNPDESRAFACNGNNAVMVIDTASSGVIANIPAAGHPIGIVMSKDGALAFVSTWGGNSVVVIDTVSLRVVKTIAVGAKPRGIDITPDGSRVIVVNNHTGTEGGSVSVIDARTQAVVQTIATKLPPYGIAITPDGNSFYVGCGIGGTNQGTVVQYNTHTLAEIRTIPINTYPRGIVVNHAGTRAYVCDANIDRVLTIDTASGGVIGTHPVGKSPVDIVIATDDSRAYVTCIYDNTVWSISLLPGASGLGVQNAEEPQVTHLGLRAWPPIPGDVV